MNTKGTGTAAESAAIPAEDQNLPWVGYWDEYPETTEEIDSHEYDWAEPQGMCGAITEVLDRMEQES